MITMTGFIICIWVGYEAGLEEELRSIRGKDDDDAIVMAPTKVAAACAVSKWGAWSQPHKCGFVDVTRVRKVIRAGTHCPSLTQKKELCHKCTCQVSKVTQCVIRIPYTQF
jgi:hypothetical protein